MTNKGFFVIFNKHYLKVFQSTVCPQYKGVDDFYANTDTCNGVDDLGISVNSVCFGGRFRFRVLSPVLQLFRLYFLLFIVMFFLTYFDGYQGLQCREGKIQINLETVSNLKLSHYCAAVQVLIAE